MVVCTQASEDVKQEGQRGTKLLYNMLLRSLSLYIDVVCISPYIHICIYMQGVA